MKEKVFERPINKVSPCHARSTEGLQMETTVISPPLHCLKLLRRRLFNRVFAVIYTVCIFALLYHNLLTLLHSTTIVSFFISLSIFISHIVLGYMWSTTQAYRMNPIARQEFPQNLEKVLDRKDFPALDIFICTADPYKEPPIDVVNTALSVMAYDYLPEKLSVYVSDDGGSELTLFAFMEAAEFGRTWLPFCRENDIIERCPDAYFSSNPCLDHEAEKIKTMYESMKKRVQDAVDRGKISEEYMSTEQKRQILSQWSKDFTRQNHPSVVQVLLDANDDKDTASHPMPNLIYVSREKNKAIPHHFKAGALNALLRVSAVMTNAPFILTLDCDMYSNDPVTPRRVLCYLSDQSGQPTVGFVQFPQRYHGLNEADIYACEHKRLFQINPTGMDGFRGPNYVGTGCFFRRRVFFGGPLSLVEPETPELRPCYTVRNPIKSPATSDLVHRVARCNYENESNWGSKIGFRYGSLVEDYYTGYRLQCEGWSSIFCNPERPAFLGDIPISLIDVLNQNKRWVIGLLEVSFSKYNPLTYGIPAMGIFMGLSYAHIAFWAIWTFPIFVYAFLPSLMLLNGVSIFPKVNEPWFLLYVFLFLGAYGQDYLDFILAQGTFRRWWSDQRMWLIRGLSSYFFGLLEFIMKSLDLATHGFNVTSKVIDDEQSKRYDRGIFEFGVISPMFVTLVTAAMLNLVSFVGGLLEILKDRSLGGFFIQIFIAGFGIINSWPLYQAMVWRTDKGRMPTKIAVASSLLVGGLYAASSFTLKT